jgi:hypothetical protein
MVSIFMTNNVNKHYRKTDVFYKVLISESADTEYGHIKLLFLGPGEVK